MLSSRVNLGKHPTAESDFAAAFERLKLGKTVSLPLGSPVSQNNVAKEAGRDPSALRKSRYPKLINEIQAWVALHNVGTPTSARKNAREKKNKNRSLKQIICELRLERDLAQSLLIEADAKILELLSELEDIKSKQASINVHPVIDISRLG